MYLLDTWYFLGELVERLVDVPNYITDKSKIPFCYIVMKIAAFLHQMVSMQTIVQNVLRLD